MDQQTLYRKSPFANPNQQVDGIFSETIKNGALTSCVQDNNQPVSSHHQPPYRAKTTTYRYTSNRAQTFSLSNAKNTRITVPRSPVYVRQRQACHKTEKDETLRALRWRQAEARLLQSLLEKVAFTSQKHAGLPVRHAHSAAE